MDTHRRSIFFAALAVATACMQCAATLMAPEKAQKDSAVWNEAETSALVDYLLKHVSEMADAGAFKSPTWNAAATDIAKHHTTGPVKTGKMCKGKYTTVCTLIFHVALLISCSLASNDLQNSPGFEARIWIILD